MAGLPKTIHPLKAAQLKPVVTQDDSFAKILAWITEIESVKSVEESIKAGIPKTVAHALSPVCTTHIGEDGYTEHLQRYEISSVKIEDLELALHVLENANQGCGTEAAIMLLTALGFDVNTHQLDDFPNRLASYARKLEFYPIDVAAAACRSLGETSKWFPAWAEIFEAVEWRVRKRRLFLDALTKKLEIMQKPFFPQFTSQPIP